MTQQIRGLVLRTVDVGDYDCVLTLLTAQEGKISVFARDVYKRQVLVRHFFLLHCGMDVTKAYFPTRVDVGRRRSAMPAWSM